jgi:hypothetical protein
MAEARGVLLLSIFVISVSLVTSALAASMS